MNRYVMAALIAVSLPIAAVLSCVLVAALAVAERFAPRRPQPRRPWNME